MSSTLPNTVSPFEEMVAYETLWALPNETIKTIAEKFEKQPGLPSELLQSYKDFFDIPELYDIIREFLKKLAGFSIAINGTFQYPQKLRAARYPLELFYYKGDIGFAESRCISVVGSRKCSEMGRKRTSRLVRGLVEAGCTIVSGLAAGVDTVAMTTAIGCGGATIGVIGTPITEYYPKENRELQDKVAQKYCLISQVPFYRYQQQPFQTRKYYFPQRNETMAALSDATVIVEAGETSGTLTQARACLQQGRKLFILNSCFENPNITWPVTYEERGAIRVNDIDDILSVLKE